ncbi:hypothetical protein J6590_024224 [Homalodisca vitripennis]|nr:hypothetical protein J6590_024224 [Homalodisca vitripennis]
MDSISTDSENEDTTRHQTTKKMKKTGRMSLAKMFEKVGNGKTEFINRMNSFGSNDSVNAYLAGLNSVIPVARRRPRVDDNEAKFRDANFAYNVRFVDDSGPIEIAVCKKAFMALHGIGQAKVAYILNSLKRTGDAPKDQRGKHKKHKHAFSEDSKKKKYVTT